MDAPKLKCEQKVGCHACPVLYLSEEFRLLRNALKEAKTLIPLGMDRAQRSIDSIITHINCWIEPDAEVKS